MKVISVYDITVYDIIYDISSELLKIVIYWLLRVEDYLSQLKFRNWQQRGILSCWKMEKSHSRGRL